MTISRTRKCIFYAAFIFPSIKHLHYRPNPTCLLVIPGKAKTLAKTAGEMGLVLYCRSGWFSVYVCVRAHISVRWGEDGTVCMVWKRWGGVLTVGKLWHWAQAEIKSI